MVAVGFNTLCYDAERRGIKPSARINMLIAEYDYDTDIAVQRAEEREIAFAEGIEQGSYQKAVESARILKQLHCDTGMIAQATGLSEAEIEAL